MPPNCHLIRTASERRAKEVTKLAASEKKIRCDIYASKDVQIYGNVSNPSTSMEIEGAKVGTTPITCIAKANLLNYRTAKYTEILSARDI